MTAQGLGANGNNSNKRLSTNQRCLHCVTSRLTEASNRTKVSTIHQTSFRHSPEVTYVVKAPGFVRLRKQLPGRNFLSRLCLCWSIVSLHTWPSFLTSPELCPKLGRSPSPKSPPHQREGKSFMSLSDTLQCSGLYRALEEC